MNLRIHKLTACAALTALLIPAVSMPQTVDDAGIKSAASSANAVDLRMRRFILAMSFPFSRCPSRIG